MAVVALKGSIVTNADGTVPQTLNQARSAGARLKEMVDTIELANGDSIGSTYRLARVHSSWRISELILFCDAITSGAGDIGLYDTARNGGLVVDADFFASAQSIATATQVGFAVGREVAAAATVMGEIANIRKAIWEVLGLTADPNKMYDIVLTLTAATTAAGTVSLITRYSDGN
jgi:hypothetical protein